MEQELEALEQEELDKDLLGVGTSTNELPEVPIGDLKEPATTPKEKEKKKGKRFAIAVCHIRPICSICLSIHFSFAVVAKPAEDDDDMKLLMSWAN